MDDEADPRTFALTCLTIRASVGIANRPLCVAYPDCERAASGPHRTAVRHLAGKRHFGHSALLASRSSPAELGAGIALGAVVRNVELVADQEILVDGISLVRGAQFVNRYAEATGYDRWIVSLDDGV